MYSMVLYESQFGNTQRIAELIAKALEEYGPVNVAPISEHEPALLAGVDLVLVGAPTQGHGMTEAMRRFVDNFVAPRRGIAAAAFDTRLKGPNFLWGSAAREVAVRLDRNGFEVLCSPESFLVTMSKEPVLQDGEERHAAMWARGVAKLVRRPDPVAV